MSQQQQNSKRDLRNCEQVTSQVKNLAKTLANETQGDASERAAFSREFSASGTGKGGGVAAIEP
jgi:hypothetical protein